MSYRLAWGTFTATLLMLEGGCTPTIEEQVGTFVRDFLLQALAAYLL